MGRIEEICRLIDPCETFADIGCDHGYCTQNVLKSCKCRHAIISDISAKSLAKAEKLLAPYIGSGAVSSVCCDGLEKIPRDTEQVLIAGMGGEEIIKIFKSGFIPKKFVLQPMKNAEKVRAFLLESGCVLTVDDIFSDGNFYFIIKGENSGGTQTYFQAELTFGKDSIKNPIFKQFADEELKKKKSYIQNCAEGSDCERIKKYINLLEEVVL